MRKTLYLKFVLGYLIFGFFGFLVVATFVSSMTLEHLKREKADSLYKEATLIANTYASDLYSSNVSLEEVKKQLDALSTYLSSQIWIINPSGRIIMTTETPLDVEHESRVENFDSTITAGSFYTVGDFFGCFQQEMLSVFAPITSNFKVQGYVVIHIPMADIRASSESLLNISYIMLVIFFLLSLIILIFFTEMVYLPLRKITAATEQYAAGNLHYEFQVDSEDEIGYLAASLSLMASEIARAEDNQKKFIANVSHDFRSPLTSIKGYLEAMLDGTIPPELHEKYLGIVLNETERLTKLTNSLLTLNNLNMKGMILEKSVFDLNSVIRSTAASFEGTCQQKHIGIELLLTGDRMPVLADKSKIEQVLYNLLDNAIKFSHPDKRKAWKGFCLRQGQWYRNPEGQPAADLRSFLQDRPFPWQRQKGNRAGTFHYKRNYPGAQRKYQRHQHRGRRERVYLLPARAGQRSVGRNALRFPVQPMQLSTFL